MTPTNALIFAGVAVALLPGMSLAQDTHSEGFLVDSYGTIVTSATTGVCVSTAGKVTGSDDNCVPEPARKVQAPVPRTATVTPPPRVAPPPPPPPPPKVQVQKFNFSADALFAFNRAELKPEGRAMLDGLARDLKGAQYDAILVTGHTDRFGKVAYNQKLSERRANAVRDYLVSRDVPANRISAEGKGEMQSVTQAGDCQGAKSVKVIACLQPDRRVHVEMMGTRPLTTGSR